MLLVTAFIECAPDARNSIRRAASDLIAAARRDDGCEEYGLYEDVQAPGRFVFVERWRDRTALDEHLATPHVAAWMQAVGGKLTNPHGVVYEMASSELLMP